MEIFFQKILAIILHVSQKNVYLYQVTFSKTTVSPGMETNFIKLKKKMHDSLKAKGESVGVRLATKQ